MKKIKYLYIDDEVEHAKNSANGFNSDNILINVESPTANGMDVLDKLGDYDGAILDLRLDDNRLSNIKVNIRGTSIAQEIRTRATEGSIRDLPIILFSADSKLVQSYNKDSTSHDLFDYKISKEDSTKTTFFENTRSLLVAYAQAYKFLGQARKKNDLFYGFDLNDKKNCHQGFLGTIEQSTSDVPIHELVRTVKSEIEMSGVLIDEILLAIRLGIDRKQSQDWATLKEMIKTTAYTGILADYYPRWWMHLVKNFWTHHISQDQRLENLSASNRVELIKTKLGLQNLVPIQKEKENRGSNFWIACKATQQALTIEDGVRLFDKDYAIWREPAYISAKEYFAETQKGTSWQKVDPSELERLAKLKKIYTNGRQRREN